MAPNGNGTGSPAHGKLMPRFAWLRLQLWALNEKGKASYEEKKSCQFVDLTFKLKISSSRQGCSFFPLCLLRRLAHTCAKLAAQIVFLLTAATMHHAFLQTATQRGSETRRTIAEDKCILQPPLPRPITLSLPSGKTAWTARSAPSANRARFDTENHVHIVARGAGRVKKSNRRGNLFDV